MVSRAEHRRATLLRLGNAAVELFDSVGPRVTIDAIAEHAGVSRRTVFRYVEFKEELAYVHPLLWLDVFDEFIATHAQLSPVDRILGGGRALGAHIDADPEGPRRAFMVAAGNPDLAKGFTAIFQRWVDRVAAEVLVDASHPPTPEQRFQSRVVAGAVMGVIDAVTREWLFASQDVRFTDLFEDGYALLEPLLSGLELRTSAPA